MKKRNYRGFGFYAVLVIVVVVLWLMLDAKQNAANAYTMTEFKTALTKEDVVYIEIEQNREIPTGVLNIRLKDNVEKELYVTDVNEIQDLLAEHDFTNYYVSDVPPESWLLNLLPLLIVLATMFILFMIMSNQAAAGGGGSKMMNFGKSRAKLSTEENKMNFGNVAGLQEEKAELEELVDFLKAPRKYTRLGARIPKGVLLVGPPGTGKTLLAKAVAGEAGVPFFSISGSDFVEMFVGVGASRVRDLFEEAKKNAPCIVFIDESDAVARRRGTGMGGGHDEREQTLNQLLTEMDGFGANEGIIIIAATNRPDVLDPALLRPGRFDRQVTVNLPDAKGREEILGVHAKGKTFAKGITMSNIAKRTVGFSGADLENLLNEAALLTVRRNKSEITMSEIDEAHDRVLMGPAKKSKKYTEKEKKTVAYHEAGHAVVGLKLEGANDVQKITIIPRGSAGGYNLMLPKEETYLSTKNELLQTISGLLAGRVAEEIMFNEITTGASNDFQQATKIARAMVTEYGMSDLGPVQFEHQSSSVFLGRDYNKQQNFSTKVADEIDEEVRKIIGKQYEVTKKLIKDNMDLLNLIANTLLEYETITKEQIDYLVEHGKMPEEAEAEKTTEDQKKDAEIKEASLEDLSLEELKDLAEEKEIDIQDKTKEELIELLKEDKTEK